MEAQAWTAIALLGATLIGVLVYQGTRIDGLADRIDAQGARLDARIDAQGARLDARIDELATRLEARLDEHASRMDRLAEEVRGLAVLLGDHLQRHAG